MNFQFIPFFIRFCIGFMITFLVLLPATTLISMGKIAIVRSILTLIFAAKTPYIHPIPFFKSISIGIPSFMGLFFADYLSKSKTSRFKKQDLLKLIFCIVTIWLLEVFGNLLEIMVTKMDLNTFLPNFAITFFLSIGSFFFPFLFWFLFYYRFPKN